MSSIQEIPRGQLSTIILMTLSETDKYGYEIIDDVLKKTNGQMSIKQPSLYSSLKRMEEQSLISSYWRDSEIGGKRHYYHLTDLGKKHLEKWQANITLPTQEPVQQTKVLQQENLFNLTTAQKAEETITSNNEETDQPFVQFDIFSNSQIITPPACDEQKSEKQNIAQTQQEKPDVKEDFLFVKKSNRSFSDSIKTINSINNKKYIEESPSAELSAGNTYLKSITQELEQNIDTLNITEDIQNETNTINTDLSPKISIQNLEGYQNNIPTQQDNSDIVQNDTLNSNNNSLEDNIAIKSPANPTIISNDIRANQNEKQKDDGVVITERLNINDIPKNPRFEARKFEIYLSDNTLTPKSNAKNSYEDRLKELYEKSKHNAENQEIELIDSKINFASYEDLQAFYKEQNIKFKPYIKSLYKSEKNFDMIKINKLNLLTTALLLILFSTTSLLFAIPFSLIRGIQNNHVLLYLLVPVTLLCLFIANIISYNKAPQKKIAFDTNKFKFSATNMILSLLIVPFIISINLIFGMTFNNIVSHLTSIILPCQFAFVYLAYYLIQKKISKNKSLY